MDEVLMGLQAELQKREAALVAKLTRCGMDDLATDYNDINIVRSALEVLNKKPLKATRNGSVRNSDQEPAPEGFVLNEAVRMAIRRVHPTKKFRSTTIYDLLAESYPNYITSEKKASISATLSNLVAAGEISKSTDQQRKVWYQAINLRKDEADADPEQDVSAYTQPEPVFVPTAPVRQWRASDDDVPF